MIINNNTEITLIEGNINIQNMIIENNNKEYNNNGTIRIINGDITINQITINNEIETCNELISFKNNNNFHLPSIYYKNGNHTNKDVNGIMINNNKLYRICKSTITDNKVICHMKGTTYSNSFVVHCPCYQDNCSYNINNQTIDIEEHELQHELIIYGNSKFIN